MSIEWFCWAGPASLWLYAAHELNFCQNPPAADLQLHAVTQTGYEGRQLHIQHE